MSVTGLPGPGDLFGRYRIERQLGRGGMGVVLAATHLELERRVALKLMAPELIGHDDLVARFRREAMALAKLESAHVVQVYDAGEQDGWLYIATQLVPDGDLADLIAHGRLPVGEGLDFVDQVLAGLGDAHAAGLLHRDVKPSNVLLREERGHRRAFLCDFGIAQTIEPSGTRTTGVIGTWTYLAPERLRGETATVRSDLYAVGCLLWAVLTGEPPYSGTYAQLAIAHDSAPLPRVGTGEPWAVTVDTVLARSLAKRPEDRYATAEEMRAELQAARRLVDAGAGRDRTHVHVPGPGGGTAERGALPATEVPGGGGRARPRRSSRRTAAIAVAAAAVVGIVGGVAVGLGLLVGGDPDDATAGDGGSGASAGAGSSPAGRRGSTGPTCWNGAAVERLSSCLEPYGVAGLAWVFPSFDADTCTDLRATSGGSLGRPQLWECLAQLDDGSQVRINYSQWRSVEGGSGYYSGHLGDPQEIREDGEVAYLRWSGIDKGTPKLAQMYAGHAFGVTVYAPEEALLDDAFALVEMRPAGEVRGTE